MTSYANKLQFPNPQSADVKDELPSGIYLRDRVSDVGEDLTQLMTDSAQAQQESGASSSAPPSSTSGGVGGAPVNSGAPSEGQSIGGPAVDPELDAKRAIYRSTLKQVWGVFRRKGCPESELLDLAQKTYSIAFSRWHTFRGDSRRETWVIAIALNVARDYHRRNQRNRLEFSGDEQLEEGKDVWSAPDRSPEEQAQWRERWTRLQKAMEKLRPDEREVVELLLLEQFSVSEVARHLGIAQRRAYTLRDSGLAKLNSSLKRAK